MIKRMYGVCIFNRNVYQEIIDDTYSTHQAALVVLVLIVAGVIGSVAMGMVGLIDLLIFLYLPIVWIGWSSVAYFVGTKVFPSEGTDSNWATVLRVGGFAMTPFVFDIFDIFYFVLPIVLIWFFCTALMSVNIAFNYDSKWKSALVVAVSMVVFAVPFIVITLNDCAVYWPETQEILWRC